MCNSDCGAKRQGDGGFIDNQVQKGDSTAKDDVKGENFGDDGDKQYEDDGDKQYDVMITNNNVSLLYGSL